MRKLFWGMVLLGGMAWALNGYVSTKEECDPSKDEGYLGKIGCTVSGAYAERIEQKEQQLADLREEIARINALTRERETQRSSMVQDYDVMQKMLVKSQAELDQVWQSLQSKKALSQNLERQIDDKQK